MEQPWRFWSPALRVSSVSTSRALLERGEQVVGIDNLNDYYDVALKQARLASSPTAGDRFRFERSTSPTPKRSTLAEHIEIDRVVHLGAQAGVRYSLDNPARLHPVNLVGHSTARARPAPPARATWSTPRRPRSMAATRDCRSASRTGSTIRSRSMPRPRRPTS